MARCTSPSGRPGFVEEVAASEIFQGTPALDVLLDAQVRSVVSVPPATGDGTLIGAVSVRHTAPRPWTPGRRATLARLAAAARRAY
ncbi:GAF domain-containing protein [Streptomyces sp. NPDC001536]|uniref:GAF domain-containing protein n=1 Tax=Streptomyces sp. NPDC001536 TaxID=3364583 RepID=UPI003690AE93